MKKVDVGQLVQLLANLGVLAGIVFLAIEIGQNTAMIEAQMAQSRADTAMNNAESVYNSEFLPELLVAVARNEELTEVQTERYWHWLRSVHRAQENQIRQYRAGLLGDEIARSVRMVVRSNVAAVSLARDRWEEVKSAYSDDYVALVDSVIEEYLSGEISD